jgi:hypothetical protein
MPSKNSAVRRQKFQTSAADSMVEPITPAEEVTGVTYEEGAGWIIFFDGSVDGGFLWTDES